MINSSPSAAQAYQLSSQAWAAGHHQVVVIQASSLDDAAQVITLVRSNQVVLLNCEALEQGLAQRLIDMVHGGVSAMDGHLQAITQGVVLACSGLTAVQGPARQRC